MQTVIVKVDWSSEKHKKKVIELVSKNEEVQSFNVDDKNKQLTVNGSMDPISLLKKMRKKVPTADIVYMESEASRMLEASQRQSNPRNWEPSAPPLPGYLR
ncbi:hypothetical protein ACJRO7_002720 [Eucalyptus globulus]|uniref:HMA domain-containing protein n=1 Tax=Eucalyptus globulus TaxID=34317 RepID=A0ABD3LWE0_EUCGL